MAVFRVQKNNGYTVMSNHHLRNSSLSLKAKGLLSQILSLPEGWDYTLSGLAAINREGVDAISSAVKELEEYGYIRRQRTQDSGGKFSGIEYVIYEQPVSAEPLPENPVVDNPDVDNPVPEKPELEKPVPENPGQLNKDISSKDLSKRKNKKEKKPVETIDPKPVFVEWIRNTFPTKSADDMNRLYSDLVRYTEMRADSKSKLNTPRKVSGLLSDLIDESGSDLELMCRMLRKATNNCWLSVHAPKGTIPAPSPPTQGMRYEEV